MFFQSHKQLFSTAVLPFFADACDSNINSYCSLDDSGNRPLSQLTLGEKEQAFLEALSVG